MSMSTRRWRISTLTGMTMDIMITRTIACPQANTATGTAMSHGNTRIRMCPMRITHIGIEIVAAHDN